MDCQPNDFDRNIQQQMYSQVELDKWGVFCEKFNEKEAKQFIEEIKKCMEQFKYRPSEPRLFVVQGRGF